MRSGKRFLSLVLVIAVVVSAMCIYSAAADKAGGRFLSPADGDTRYKKPGIGTLVKDGQYPEEIKASDNSQAKEKEWYEYVVYSKNAIGETINPKDSSMKVVFYDPYDYSYGTVMEIDDEIENVDKGLPGKGYEIKDSFSSANSKSITYSTSVIKTVSDSNSHSNTLGGSLSGAIKWPMFELKLSIEYNHTWGSSHTYSQSTTESVSVNETYHAVYFNTDGVPYQWKIVTYTVWIPLYYEIEYKQDGVWTASAESGYCLLPTFQGTCRMYIKNGITYIEDWATGEPVAVDDFWKSFFTKNRLIEAYENKLIPNR